MWVPPEETDPVLLHAPTRKSVALFGAVNLRTGQLVTQFCSPFNAITFGTFLRTLLRHRSPTRRLVLVLDNARYHHATLLRPYLTEKRHLLSLSFLPPYSPALNPIERVWKLARKLCVPTTNTSPCSRTWSPPCQPNWNCGENPTQSSPDYAALYKSSCIIKEYFLNF